jgi:hypothetical protein
MPASPVFTAAVIVSCASAAADQPAAFRPPAVPLVTHDPYFSVWSFNDRLTDDWSRHWTGAIQAICGLCRIDGKAYRFCGPQPKDAEAMKQTGLEVWPTRTIYEFEAGGVRLVLTFMTPLLPDDLDLISRPVTYLSWQVRAIDQAPHDVSIYLDCTAEWAVNTPDQKVVTSRHRCGDLTLLRVGTQEQPVLARSGDNLRIDWGYLYLGIPQYPPLPNEVVRVADMIGGHETVRHAFARDGELPKSDDLRFPRAANDDWPVLAMMIDHGKIGSSPVSRHVQLAYDDQYCIEYFGRRLRPYWRRTGMEFDEVLRLAEEQYATLVSRCTKFDEELTADQTKVGGDDFARLAALAYRQCLAAHKLAADFDGTPLMFPKENFSNGCIGTVDVIYPSSPFFLLLNPRLLEAQLLPVLEYARSPRWRFPFAPHDLGTYPLANGQVYGGGEKTEENQMPVEESANILLMIAALARCADSGALAARYAAQLDKWAAYLADEGFDPANQLCTDDFAGHLAHNTNLSIKAIVALGAYAELKAAMKRLDEANKYRGMSEQMAADWIAQAADGSHHRLAFDRPGTWSQKYNLVWDKVLDLKLFPPEVARAEVAYYRTKLNKYGLPLDNRETYTKLDWAVWTACLAQGRADFEAMIRPLAAFANESPNRVPLTDWFSTVDARKIGFQARSVVGGVYMPMLCDPAMWRKWADRSATRD